MTDDLAARRREREQQLLPIDGRVQTPEGPGKLIDRKCGVARVLLGSELRRAARAEKVIGERPGEGKSPRTYDFRISEVRPEGTPLPATATKVEAWVDGASSGKSDAPGGYGVVLIAPGSGRRREIKGGEAKTSNQRMEITAACVALEETREGCRVTVHSDSAYVCNFVNQKWAQKWRENGWQNSQKEEVANKDLWLRLEASIRRHVSVEFRKVKGHDGVEENEAADRLAVEAKKEVAG